MSKPLVVGGATGRETAAKQPGTEAFEVIYARYHAGVFAVVLGILGNPHDAEEAAHDVLLKAQADLDRRGLELPEASPRWMRTIARHHALDVLKHRVRTAARDERYANDCVPIATQSGSLEPALDARRLTADLREHFPDEVALVEQCIVEQHDRAALARQLGVTQNALNVRLHRAIQRLRRALAIHEA